MLLVIILFLLLILNCKSVETKPYVEIPNLEIKTERPELLTIPTLEENYSNLVEVLQTYNLNLIKLTSFIELQEFILQEQEKYYKTILQLF